MAADCRRKKETSSIRFHIREQALPFFCIISKTISTPIFTWQSRQLQLVRLLRLPHPGASLPFRRCCSLKKKKHGIDDGDCLEQRESATADGADLSLWFFFFFFFSFQSLTGKLAFPKKETKSISPSVGVGTGVQPWAGSFDFWEYNPPHATSRLERLIAELTSSFVHINTNNKQQHAGLYDLSLRRF